MVASPTARFLNFKFKSFAATEATQLQPKIQKSCCGGSTFAATKNSKVLLRWKHFRCNQKFKGLAAVEALSLQPKIQKSCCFVVRHAERKNSKVSLLRSALP